MAKKVNKTKKNEQNQIMKSIIEELRAKNPYPEDTHTSAQGKFGREVWNDCCDTLDKLAEEEK